MKSSGLDLVTTSDTNDNNSLCIVIWDVMGSFLCKHQADGESEHAAVDWDESFNLKFMWPELVGCDSDCCLLAPSNTLSWVRSSHHNVWKIIWKTTYPCFSILSSLECKLAGKGMAPAEANSNFWCYPLLCYCIYMTMG